MLTKRPAAMEASAWEFLQQRPFGSLYFPCTGPPWPEDIAEGDTDGDLSLVCWDAELVPLLAERCSPCSLAVEPPVEGARVERLGDDWLAQTHAHMLDPQTVQEQMHIGKVYTLMVKKGDAHGWTHTDYVHLARAYVQAIDGVKHGGAVKLPLHLRKELGGAFAQEGPGPAA